MFTINFINRKEELKILEEAYNTEKFEFVVVYGRRRVGKTELIKQFIKNKKSIYYLCKETTQKENITSFKKSAKHIINLDHLKDDWEVIFEHISKSVKEKLVIVLDEFPYLIKDFPGILSVFQSIIDLHLTKTKIKLVILGSSVSTIEKDILSYKSPLYGRRTAQIEVKPLKFKDSVKLLEKDVEDSIKIYGITGGIPLYLLEFKEDVDFWKLVENKVLSQGKILREEAIFLLSQEFRDPSVYFSILESIAQGKNKLGEIISFCGFKDKTNITPYLHKLNLLKIIKKERPLLSKMKKGVKYVITDQYYNFYFRFIYPNISLIEESIFDVEMIKKEYNSYLGFVFEKIAKEFLIELMKKRMLPVYNKIGKQWGKTKEGVYEIDLVALNEKEKKILFGEIKWKEKVNAKKVLKKLVEEAEYVQWHKEDRKEEFVVFAKSFKRKIESFEGKRVYCFDLKDLEKVLIVG